MKCKNDIKFTTWTHDMFYEEIRDISEHVKISKKPAFQQMGTIKKLLEAGRHQNRIKPSSYSPRFDSLLPALFKRSGHVLEKAVYFG